MDKQQFTPTFTPFTPRYNLFRQVLLLALSLLVFFVFVFFFLVVFYLSSCYFYIKYINHSVLLDVLIVN